MIEEPIYNRQEELDLIIPDSILIIGAGGIGSWTVLFSALVGIKNIVIFDPDIIEKHNLNRTPFDLDHIGNYKVFSIEKIISRKRDDVNIITFNQVINEINDEIFIEELLRNRIDIEYIIDARDAYSDLNIFKNRKVIKPGYDGFDITIQINPHLNSKNYFETGLENGYRITPSYFAPAATAAAISVNLIVSPDAQELFNSYHIINYSFKDGLIQKTYEKESRE